VTGEVDERNLVARCRAGDEIALNQLLLRWETPVYNAAYRYLGNAEEAKDASQETFLRVIRNISRFREEASFAPWIYRIAINHCKDRLKERKGKTLVSLGPGDEDETGLDLPTENPGPDDDTHRSEVRRMVQAALASLPHDQKSVIVLRHYQDLSFEEIAETLSCPLSTVKSRMYRGLLALEKRLARLVVTKGRNTSWSAEKLTLS
jgi:RNA polymerase sigma-70 factor (ECF subfamily)